MDYRLPQMGNQKFLMSLIGKQKATSCWFFSWKSFSVVLHFLTRILHLFFLQYWEWWYWYLEGREGWCRWLYFCGIRLVLGNINKGVNTNHCETFFNIILIMFEPNSTLQSRFVRCGMPPTYKYYSGRCGMLLPLINTFQTYQSIIWSVFSDS